MRDIERALSDIADIRSQLAAGTLFEGFGPAAVAATALLALAAALAQSLWPRDLAQDPGRFILVWIAVATASAAIVGIEALRRSRRHHGGLSDAMIYNAIEQFLPAGVAGAALAGLFWGFVPDALWLLPGLWQILVALGLFAAARSLPPGVRPVAAFYLLGAVLVIVLSSADRVLLPWAMGLPFAIGQLSLAAVLHLANPEDGSG